MKSAIIFRLPRELPVVKSIVVYIEKKLAHSLFVEELHVFVDNRPSTARVFVVLKLVDEARMPKNLVKVMELMEIFKTFMLGKGVEVEDINLKDLFNAMEAGHYNAMLGWCSPEDLVKLFKDNIQNSS
jgi:hypothetical protein